jgi:hypothetical protein
MDNPLFFGECQVASGGGGSGFHRSITIDHTQVGASDLTDFPLLVAGTFSYLATVANGGNVQNSSGFDVIFTSDSAGLTTLAFEPVLYIASTGQVVFWVKVPTVSHTVDTVIYIRYGNASITTDRSNKTGTWDSNYLAVYHLSESSNPFNDSTSNAKNSTAGTYPSQVSGNFGNAQSFVSGSSQHIDVPVILHATGSPGPPVTVSAWYKSSTAIVNAIFDGRSLSHIGVVLYVDASGFAHFFVNESPGSQDAAGSTNLSDGNWHYIVGVINPGTSHMLYVDGAQIITEGTSNWGGAGSSTGRIGGSWDPNYSTSVIQEARGSKIDRSSWITAEYNNQKPSSTFLTISAPL